MADGNSFIMAHGPKHCCCWPLALELCSSTVTSFWQEKLLSLDSFEADLDFSNQPVSNWMDQVLGF